MIAVTTLLAVLFAYPVLSSGELLRRQLDLSAVPSCGQTCLITAATSPEIVGSCALTDVACLCKNEKLMSSVTSCALSSCSTPDQVKLLTFATQMCPGISSPTAESSAPAPSLPNGAPGDLAGLPACGQSCLIETATNSAVVGSCSLTDVGCLCKNADFMGTVTTCVASKCSLNEKLTMLTWSTTACPADGASTGPTLGANPPVPATSQVPSANALDSYTSSPTNSTSGVIAVIAVHTVQTGIISDTNISTSGSEMFTNHSVVQNLTDITNSSRSSAQAVHKNVTTSVPPMNHTGTTTVGPAPAKTTLPASYLPSASSACTVFRTAPSFWVLAAVLIPTMLLW